MQQVVERPPQAEWQELLEGVRNGDMEPCVSLQERLKPGLRLLLARKCLRQSEEVVTAAVLSSVVESVRRGEIASAAELARAARIAIAAHVAPRRAPARETLAANPADALSDHLSVREREMMRRFYILAEEPVDICRAMGVTLEEFKRVKSLARAAVAVSLETSRRVRSASV